MFFVYYIYNVFILLLFGSGGRFFLVFPAKEDCLKLAGSTQYSQAREYEREVHVDLVMVEQVESTKNEYDHPNEGTDGSNKTGR